MPADGFDAAAKKFGTSARPGGSSQAMDGQYTSSGGVGSGQPKQTRPMVSVVGALSGHAETA